MKKKNNEVCQSYQSIYSYSIEQYWQTKLRTPNIANTSRLMLFFFLSTRLEIVGRALSMLDSFRIEILFSPSPFLFLFLFLVFPSSCVDKRIEYDLSLTLVNERDHHLDDEQSKKMIRIAKSWLGLFIEVFFSHCVLSLSYSIHYHPSCQFCSKIRFLFIE